MKRRIAVLLLVFTALSSGLLAQPIPLVDTTGLTGTYRFFDRPIDPERYLLRPGDQLSVTFVNAQVAPLTLNLDPEGRVVHQTLGVFDLADKTLADARRELDTALQSLYNVEQINLSIAAPLKAGIDVSGTVRNPGLYIGYTSQRVSEIIDSAGGIRPDGSTRWIVLRGGPEPVPVDLDRAVYLGEAAFNPPLYAGFTVHVPAKSEQVVHVVGEVNDPRDVEWKPGDDLQRLLALAGGVKASADTTAVTIIRGSESMSGREATVQPGDIVVVPSRLNDDGRRTVVIYGSIGRPGHYPYESGLTLADALAAAGGFVSDAAPGGTTVFRLVTDRLPGDDAPRRFPIGNVVDGNGATNEVLLHPDDSIYVPPQLGYIRVTGEVRNPGMYPYQSGRAAREYITMAGGFLPTADRERMEIFHRVSRLTSTHSPDVRVHDGDEIVVRRREELR